MISWLVIIGESIASFAATNIDDLLLLILLFARQVPTRRIVTGQYLGFAAIILLSIFGAFLATIVPASWFHFLGILPAAIGIKQLVAIKKYPDATKAKTGLLSIALITFSNGGDNVGVYIPFFALDRSHLPLILLVYGVLIAVLCFISRWLGRHSVTLNAVRRGGRYTIPAIFIALGLCILLFG